MWTNELGPVFKVIPLKETDNRLSTEYFSYENFNFEIKKGVPMLIRSTEALKMPHFGVV